MRVRGPDCEQYLIGVIGGGAGALHTVSGHDRPQVIAFHQELVLLLPTLLVDVDDGSGHLWDALHHHLDSETQTFEALQCPWPPSHGQPQKPQPQRGCGRRALVCSREHPVLSGEYQ